MKTKKATAFWVAVASINLMYFVTLFVSEAVAMEIGPIALFAVAVAGGIFQAANVADNVQRAKHFVPELHTEGK